MRALNIFISDIEYNMFGLNTDKLLFSELVAIVRKQLSCEALNDCVQLTEKHGLSGMSMEDISKEVKAVRSNAKNN